MSKKYPRYGYYMNKKISAFQTIFSDICHIFTFKNDGNIIIAIYKKEQNGVRQKLISV